MSISKAPLIERSRFEIGFWCIVVAAVSSGTFFFWLDSWWFLGVDLAALAVGSWAFAGMHWPKGAPANTQLQVKPPAITAKAFKRRQ